jgi:hypothetical protein
MTKLNTICNIVLIGIIGLLCNCQSDNNNSSTISGQVKNAFTNEPVANAEVSILENGPIIYSDSNGNFEFTPNDLSSLDIEKVTTNGFNGVAISLSHEDYRPIEAKINYNHKIILKLAEKSTPAYVYNEPVQLNDGINVGNLTDVKMDLQMIYDGMDGLFRDKLKEVHSVLIFKDNRLVLEEYLFGNNDTIQFENGIIVDSAPEHIQWSRKEKHYVASVNKALTSTLVGIALDQNGISINDKIANYLPDYSQYFDDPNKAAIDFEDCLTMTSGLQWDEWGNNDLTLLWKSNDFADFALSRTGLGPGFEWRYNSALPNILIKSIDNMNGGNVREWAHQNFYSKLGIEDYNWQSQPDGYPEGAARMFIRSRDLLKIGITYLNNGKWNGEQVIPESWVNECFKVKENTSSGDYSYHFWLRSLGGVQYLSADGDGGNYINIFPEQNMVVVVTQGNYLKWPFYVKQVEDLMENYILPAIQD